jgi:hypothetical protein
MVKYYRSLLTLIDVCNRRNDCPFHGHYLRLGEQGNVGSPVPTPMTRFLDEPSHEYGIAFVRPDNHFLMLEVYMEALKEGVDVDVDGKE